jgi:hypothetical protein
MASGHLEKRSKKGWTIVIDYGRVQVSKAIETVFPKTEQQLCVIHQIRNSTKYIPYRDLKPVMKDSNWFTGPRRSRMPNIGLRNSVTNGAISTRMSLGRGTRTGRNSAPSSNTLSKSAG